MPSIGVVPGDTIGASLCGAHHPLAEPLRCPVRGSGAH
jgi:hypothetical protein